MQTKYYLIGDDIPNFVPFMKGKDLEKYYDDLSVYSPEYIVISNVTETKKIYNSVVIARLHKIPIVFYYHSEPEPEKKHRIVKVLKRIGVKFYYNFGKISDDLKKYIIDFNEKMLIYFVGDYFVHSREYLDHIYVESKREKNHITNGEKLIFRIKKCYSKTIFYGLLYSGSVKIGQKIYLENEEMVVSSLHTSKREEKEMLSGKQLCSIKVATKPNIKKTRGFLITDSVLQSHKTKHWIVSTEITRNGSFHITKGYTGHALTKYCPLTFRVEKILSDKQVLYPGDRAHIIINTEKNIYVEDQPISELDRTLIFKDTNILAIGTFIG